MQSKTLQVLYRKFASQRMVLGMNGGEINQRELFHSATDKVRKKISEYGSAGGFDPRISCEGEYGFGAYFAEHAIYGASYGMHWLYR